MYIPCARERVQVAGRWEIFFVLTVYSDAGDADLIPLNGVAYYVEHRVPFALLKPYNEVRHHEALKRMPERQETAEGRQPG